MRRKTQFTLVAICALAVGIAALLWLTQLNQVTITIPNGPTLKLIEATYDVRSQMWLNQNPAKRALQKLSLLSSKVFPRLFMQTNTIPFHTGPGEAVFWFSENPYEPDRSRRTWCAVQDPGEPYTIMAAWKLHAWRWLNHPGIVAITWPECPTNEETLELSFYNENNMARSNVLGRIKLKNPAFHK